MPRDLDSSYPHRYPRRLLLLVTGLKPQIVTETLYKLAVKNKPAFIPHEVHIITTKEGADYAKKYLLGEKNLGPLKGEKKLDFPDEATPLKGYIHQFCEDYHLDNINFDESMIHVFDGTTSDLKNDAEAEEDNGKTATFIGQKIQEFTQYDNTALHVSLSGGRRNMSYYMGSAISLYGRMQDRLSHILVDRTFEETGLFYPAPNTKDNFKFILSNFIFLRASINIPKALLDGRKGYKEIVETIQQFNQPPKVELYCADFYIVFNDQPVKLPPLHFAFYYLFCLRQYDDKAGFNVKEEEVAYFTTLLSLLRELGEDLSKEAENIEDFLEKSKVANKEEILDAKTVKSLEKKLQEDKEEGKHTPEKYKKLEKSKQQKTALDDRHKRGFHDTKGALNRKIDKVFSGIKELATPFKIEGKQSSYQLNIPKESITIHQGKSYGEK